MKQSLPPEFTHLVDWSVTELGKVIEFELGRKSFDRIEKIRRFVKSPAARNLKGLISLKDQLAKLSPDEQYEIAHAFALMLELINACEAAYRTHRLKIEDRDLPKRQHSYGRIIHVLTAHPTESRSPDIIFYFKKIQELLERRLEQESLKDTTELNALLKWAWNIPMSKQRKPTVMDEAEYIYSLALQKDIIEIYLKHREAKHPFYIRTWVGGDKDGHPGVDEKTMLASLNMARGFLYRWLKAELHSFLEDLKPLVRAANLNKKSILEFQKNANSLRSLFSKIRTIQSGDGKHLHKLKSGIDELIATHRKIFGVESPKLIRMQRFMKVFPGLVVPLEIREDSAVVHEAVDNPQKDLNISRMLKTLAKITGDTHDPRFYVRGFVLSNTEAAPDIEAGLALAKRHLKQERLPVVPLFESAHALSQGTGIIEELLAKPRIRTISKKHWSGQFEVMLGYSDSAKENGSFASRHLIQTAITKLERVITKRGIEPIFFHGSGGSIERGGGGVQEQTEWWPLSALLCVKVTVQGEMIYRNYTAPEILDRQLERFLDARDHQAHTRAKKLAAPLEKALSQMASATQAAYQNTLKDPNFLELIEEATPYSYLNNLKLGSRPSKRQGPVNLKGLRAIPWVLCWTQTRALFPSWWGVGRFWKALSTKEKAQYRRAFKESALFRTYIKALGFTLEKIELDVFALYLHNSKLPPEIQEHYLKEFRAEFAAAKKCVHEVTGERNLLWYRPWLRTSISLRSPLIHPLNVLQLIALKEKDLLLLRETVTGVASGMLTTG